MDAIERFLAGRAPLHVSQEGNTRAVPVAGTLLLPGSFNPAHDGHWQLAEAARNFLGRPVAFELSVGNVDKPSLGMDDMRRRLAQFHGRADLWLTHAPRFVEKARHFPGTTFVVGLDTAARIVSPAYHGHDVAQMHAALDELTGLDTSFLVACRVDAAGQCLTLADLDLPAAYRARFIELPAACFRWDGSSTALRARGLGLA